MTAVRELTKGYWIAPSLKACFQTDYHYIAQFSLLVKGLFSVTIPLHCDSPIQFTYEREIVGHLTPCKMNEELVV